MKLTQWFPIRINPKHKGVYQIVGTGTIWYSKWTGKQWNLTCSDIHRAAKENKKSNFCYNGQIKSWRGLAVKP